MCGIIGYNFNRNLDRELICGKSSHRGPDFTSVMEFGDFVLGHNRLSIIDLNPQANQPFVSSDGNYILVFNGEIYNYKELKKTLIKDFAFKSNSDSEVLLYSYIKKGKKCLADLRGMFSFAIYDIRKNEIFCARDRLGIKPFYFYYANNKFAFASEIKVIKALLEGNLTVNESVIPQYFHYLRIPFDTSIFNEIQKLKPGHYLTFKKGELNINKYWDVEDFIGTNNHLKEGEILEELDAILDDAIRLRMISDVPLGSFLSGGLDSSLILYYMDKHSKEPINTFTIGFDQKTKYDERTDATIVAKHFNTKHHEIVLTPNITSLLPKLVHHFDEPYGNSMALLTYELTREVKKYATVALAGDGGDEIFGGYPRYTAFEYYKKAKLIPKPFIGIASRLFSVFPESSTGNHTLRRMKVFIQSLQKSEEEMYNDWVSYFTKNEINELLLIKRDLEYKITEIFKNVPSNNLIIKSSITDLKTFLPANLLFCGDRMSMANSFEVRVPLIDHEIIEFMTSLDPKWRIRNGDTKYLMRQLIRNKIPDRILEKPKWGFTSPMGEWLRKDLKDLTDKYLSEDRISNRNILNPKFVTKVVSEHMQGKRDRSSFIWSLIVFEEWCNQNWN